MKQNTESVIQEILNYMNDEIFRKAIGPRNRREYMKLVGAHGRDWHFGLSAKQIIKDKIPANVIGCTGRAKLFYELAQHNGIKAFVVCTAKYDDWQDVRDGNDKTINGHQINAVKINGKWCVFDAGRKKLQYIDTDLTPGSLIDAMSSGNKDYMVTAILPGAEFKKVNTYGKLRNLYTSGNMNDPNFTIVPITEKTTPASFFRNAANKLRNKIIQRIKLLSNTGAKKA